MAPVVVILLIFAGVILNVVLSGARVQDQVEIRRSHNTAASAMKMISRDLDYLALDHATSREAYENLAVNFDSAWANDRFGAGLRNGFGPAQVLIVDGDNALLFEGGTADALTVAALDRLIDFVRSNPATMPDDTIKFVLDGDVLYAVAARVMADRALDRPSGTVFVLAQPIDDTLLRKLSADFQLQALSFGRSSDIGSRFGIYIYGLDGEVLGVLAWTQDKPGRELLSDIVVPIVIAALISGLLLSVFLRSAVRAARVIRRGSEALVERGEALELSESKLLAIIDGVADGIFSFDDQGIITSVNDAAGRIFGYGLDEMVGQYAGMLLAKGAEDVNASALTADASIVDMQYLELAGHRKDGTGLIIDAAISHITYHSSSIAIAIMRDVTERRQAEETLNLLSTGMILVNRDCRLLLANSSAARILDGADGLTLVGEKVAARRKSDTEQLRGLVEGVCDGVREQGGPEVMTVERDGNVRPLSIMVAPLHLTPADADSAVAAIFVRDLEVRQSVPPEVLGKLFGLTPAEARVVVELVKGKRLQEVADGLGVSLNTVRNQLKQIFSKTNTGRQSELISLMLSSTALLSESGVGIDDELEEVRLTGS